MKTFSAPYDVADLLDLMRLLRDPVNGCPWDRDQTFASIVPSTIEECYELAAAIEDGDYAHVGEELGDLLFQVVFYAQMGDEQSLFSFTSIVHALVEKLIRRHPHIFPVQAEEQVPSDSTVDSVRATWETIKRREREQRSQHSALADVPVQLPALVRAQKLQRRAASVGFDWPDPAGVFEKIDEELQELRVALANGDDGSRLEELGDLLFTVVNLARHMGLDAESALRTANHKFERRFLAMEAAALLQKRSLVDLSDEDWERLWQGAKHTVSSGEP